MGKHKHTQDRMYLSASEWKNSYGGKRDAVNNSKTIQALPFHHCALSLTPFETPVCTPEGVLFDIVNLMTYIKEHKTNPVSGESMTTKDIIRLKMVKNEDGQWHCPVTCKAFNVHSHVVAIRSTGNVFLFETVNDLNIKAKNWTDLISGEKFTRSDIITLQNPKDEEICALRDINNFVHLRQMRGETQVNKLDQGKVRHTSQTSQVMKAFDERTAGAGSLLHKHDAALQSNSAAVLAGAGKDSITVFSVKGEYLDDVRDILELNPLVNDVTPGNVQTDQRSSSSFTSSYQEIHTANKARLAFPEEARLLKYKKLRELKKKAYVQLQTNVGNLNVEVHCDIVPRTAYNFLALCEQGYLDGTKFHRLIPGFMVQGGDPSGKGTGGQSVFGTPFVDEFDSRLLHSKRGVLAMANSGSNANRSQFFITFGPAEHLNNVHAIFGHVVGGLPTLAVMEDVGTVNHPSGSGSASIKGSKDAPLRDISIIGTAVFNSPWAEASTVARAEVEGHIRERELRSQQEARIVGRPTTSGAEQALLTRGPSAAVPALVAAVVAIGDDAEGGGRSEKRRRVTAADPSEIAEQQQRFLRTEGQRTQDDLLAAARAGSGAGGAGAAAWTDSMRGSVGAGACAGVPKQAKPMAAAKKSSYGNFSAF